MFSVVAVAFSSLVLTFIMAVGVAGNLLIVWIIKSSSRLKARSHILIANLAVADTLQSCNIFFMLVTAINGGYWMFGETICQITAFLTVEFVLASMLSVTTISINRYFKVMHEEKYDKIFTAKSIMIIISFIWTLPLMYAVPPLVGWSSYAFDPGKCLCLFRFRTKSSYAFFLVGTMTIPALVIICFAYFRVFQVVKLHRNRVWSLHFHQERNKLSSDEYKITSAVIIVVVSYIICFVPASVVNFIEILNSDFEFPLWLDFSSFVLIFVSHASNPLIYGFMNRQYRVSFLELLQKGSQTKRTRKNKSKRGDLHLQKHSPDPIMTSQALRGLDENNASCSKNCSTRVTKVDGRGAKSSDFSGVREVVPASLPLQEQNQVHSQQTFQRWVPPQINRLQYRDDEAVFRRVRGILNKLTPDKFDKLCNELLGVGIETKYILKGVILLVFEKALDEPKYSSMYAQLCLRLSEEAPNFDDPGKTGNSTFRRLLLKQCEDEFNNRTKASQAFDKKDGPLTPEEEEQRSTIKRKVLGNIRFIGELYKYDMLHEAIVHRCIKQLLDKKKRASVADLSESMECLCYLMRTVGPRLDIPKAKSLMDQYFERTQQLLCRGDFPVRIRFMIEDVIELRNTKWIPRKAVHETGPKMIQQIRQEAWQNQGGRPGFPVPVHGHAPRNIPPHAPGNWMNHGMGRGAGRGSEHQQMSRGMNDVFVTDNGFRPSGPRFDEFGPSGVPPDRSGFGLRYHDDDYDQFAPRDPWADLSSAKQTTMSSNSAANNSKPTGGGWRPATRQNHMSSDGEISLRPARDSIAASQRPSVHVSGRSQTPPTQKQLDPLNRTTAPPIIEKAKKQNKPQAPSTADLHKQIENIVTDFLESKDVETAARAIKDIKGARYFTSLISQLFARSLGTEDQECFSQLFVSLHKSQLLTADMFIKGVSGVLEQHQDPQEEGLKIKKHMAQFMAKAVTQGILNLIEVSSLTENGNFHPTLLLCLKELEALKGPEWLVKEFTDSKLDLLPSLPEGERASENFMSILEKQSLVFLFPLLHIQADLYSKIEEDPTVTAIYKWVKDNVESSWHTNPEFINVLATCLLKYATKDSTLSEGLDPTQAPEKDWMEKEKAAMKKLLPLVEKFVHEKSELQVSVLYALQVFCHNHSFPKGMLLRMFVLLYDTEVVEEDAFLRWKEDVSEKHPGKGKALFQVNSWLTWLETADEEGTDSEPE